MSFTRWARAAATAEQVRGAVISHKAGYRTLVPSFEVYTQVFRKDDACMLSNQRNSLLEKKTPYLFQKHGFARLIAPPPHLQRRAGLKIYRTSPGVIIDPYHEPPRSPFFQRWFTRKGWQEIKESLYRQLRSGYALAKLRQKTGKVTRQSFYTDVKRLYTQINVALAEGNRNALTDLVTESMLSTLKNEMKRREGIWNRVEWKLHDSIACRTLQARMAAVDPKDLDNAFVQITVLINSTQYFGAFDRDGNLVAGDPSKKLKVEDIWVFETCFGAPEFTFRLCGRITL